MKIAIISPGTLPVPPVEGGAVENLIDILLKKNEELCDHQITVFSSYSSEALTKAKYYKQSNFEFINRKSLIFRIKQGKYFLKKKLLSNELRNAFIEEVSLKLKFQDFDIIIVENQPKFAESLRKKFNGKLILHLHNDYISNKLLTKKLCDSYDAVITVSNFLKEKVETLKSNTPVYCVYNGLNYKNFFNVSEQKEQLLLQDLSIEKKDIVILYTGRLLFSKGVHLLIKAFKRMATTRSMKLVIVGSSNFKYSRNNKYIKFLKKIAQNDKRIIFTGYMNYNEIGNLYKIADIGVVPSINEEAFGLTALEHMASGHPVIVTNVGGLPEVVDKKSAVIIDIKSRDIISDLNQALDVLCADQQLRKSMGRLASERALTFNDSHYYDSFMKVISQKGEKNG
ncbi:glycosyltransferase family 4 protein [Jeotgalibaca sp. A127]|uniref:glycosyltransferase family 4 protein n=1 Tax=Jeotgalibaca sp. A127 TaxID=3457324 RepID=UPI003FD27BC8